MNWSKHVELGDLLNEFVDEYSCLFLATHEGFKKGLNFKAEIVGDRICPKLDWCPYPQFLNPIDRCVQLSQWLSGGIEVFSSVYEVARLLESMKFSRLQRPMLFVRDEVTFNFYQENKLVGSFTGTVKNGTWIDSSFQKKIVPTLKTRKGFPVVNPQLDVEIKLTKESDARALLYCSVGTETDLFFRMFQERCFKHIPIDYIKNLPLEPKRVTTLMQENNINLIRLNRYSSIRSQTQEAVPFSADKDSRKTLGLISYNIRQFSLGKMPFTK